MKAGGVKKERKSEFGGAEKKGKNIEERYL